MCLYMCEPNLLFKTQYRVNTVSMAARKKSQLTEKSQPASHSKEPQAPAQASRNDESSIVETLINQVFLLLFLSLTVQNPSRKVTTSTERSLSSFSSFLSPRLDKLDPSVDSIGPNTFVSPAAGQWTVEMAETANAMYLTTL